MDFSKDHCVSYLPIDIIKHHDCWAVVAPGGRVGGSLSSGTAKATGGGGRGREVRRKKKGKNPP